MQNKTLKVEVVKALAESASGRKVTFRFEKHRPLERVGAGSGRRRQKRFKEVFDSIVEPQTAIVVMPRWNLASDWRFDRILETATKALEAEGAEHPTKRIVRALHAIESAALQVHQKLTLTQLEDFWQSHDVLERFLADQELWWRDMPAEQKTMVLPAGASAGEAFRDARHLAKLYLAAYLQEIRAVTSSRKVGSMTGWQLDIYPWFDDLRKRLGRKEVVKLLGDQDPRGQGGPDPSQISRWSLNSRPSPRYYTLLVKLKESLES